MKKSSIIFIIIVLIILVAILVGPTVTGGITSHNIKEAIRGLNESAGYPIVSLKNYRKGWFSSSFSGELYPTVSQQESKTTFEFQVRHGPFLLSNGRPSMGFAAIQGQVKHKISLPNNQKTNNISDRIINISGVFSFANKYTGDYLVPTWQTTLKDSRADTPAPLQVAIAIQASQGEVSVDFSNQTQLLARSKGTLGQISVAVSPLSANNTKQEPTFQIILAPSLLSYEQNSDFAKSTLMMNGKLDIPELTMQGVGQKIVFGKVQLMGYHNSTVNRIGGNIDIKWNTINGNTMAQVAVGPGHFMINVRELDKKAVLQLISLLNSRNTAEATNKEQWFKDHEAALKIAFLNTITANTIMDIVLQMQTNTKEGMINLQNHISWIPAANQTWTLLTENDAAKRTKVNMSLTVDKPLVKNIVTHVTPFLNAHLVPSKPATAGSRALGLTSAQQSAKELASDQFNRGIAGLLERKELTVNQSLTLMQLHSAGADTATFSKEIDTMRLTPQTKTMILARKSASDAIIRSAETNNNNAAAPTTPAGVGTIGSVGNMGPGMSPVNSVPGIKPATGSTITQSPVSMQEPVAQTPDSLLKNLISAGLITEQKQNYLVTMSIVNETVTLNGKPLPTRDALTRTMMKPPGV